MAQNGRMLLVRNYRDTFLAANAESCVPCTRQKGYKLGTMLRTPRAAPAPPPAANRKIKARRTNRKINVHFPKRFTKVLLWTRHNSDGGAPLIHILRRPTGHLQTPGESRNNAAANFLMNTAWTRRHNCGGRYAAPRRAHGSSCVGIWRCKRDVRVRRRISRSGSDDWE